MFVSRRYTPEDDARIFACAPRDLPLLAKELDRSVTALQQRRLNLRPKTAAATPIYDPVPKSRRHGPPPPRNFARPDWFDEDLDRMSVTRR